MAHRPAREGSPIPGFDDFYRRDFLTLVGFLVATGFARAEAEDAAQGAMVKAYRCWSTIDHPRAWVRTVALRDATRSLRRKDDGLRRALRGGWADEPPAQAPQDAVLDGLYVIDLLARLAPRRRAVMVLHLQGFDATEIAGIVGIASDTVRSHLRHAREQLRGTVADSRIGGRT